MKAKQRRSRKSPAGMFQCRSCKKIFSSYQALGGHRANNKRSPGCTAPPPSPDANDGAGKRKAIVHECPFCLRMFASGQALGENKRSHLPCSPPSVSITSPAANSPPTTVHGASKLCKSLFDLNLPAPPAGSGGCRFDCNYSFLLLFSFFLVLTQINVIFFCLLNYITLLGSVWGQLWRIEKLLSG
ncbi:Zinc finger protein ZAT11 [Platanthera guangdongensis]|uniref:Zinc finger protein ZAT11 n=1 Tax=Platanthera guangdongensis TaxID=2320717 RepID=A0ABR2MHZ9_9ASPA